MILFLPRWYYSHQETIESTKDQEAWIHTQELSFWGDTKAASTLSPSSWSCCLQVPCCCHFLQKEPAGSPDLQVSPTPVPKPRAPAPPCGHPSPHPW